MKEERKFLQLVAVEEVLCVRNTDMVDMVTGWTVSAVATDHEEFVIKSIAINFSTVRTKIFSLPVKSVVVLSLTDVVSAVVSEIKLFLR